MSLIHSQDKSRPGPVRRPAPAQRAVAQSRAASSPRHGFAPASPRHGLAAANGLPEPLKTNIEAMSGFVMDDVRVHRNSSRPAMLGALAYAQGSDIHLAAGQESHLPHEAWHVVQQKQGRVKATAQMKGAPLNDEGELEREADRFGGLATTAPPRGASGAAGRHQALTRRKVAAALPVQRRIEYDAKTKAYFGTSTRPGWLSEAQTILLGKLNALLKTNYTSIGDVFSINKQDRAHVVPFEKIQTWILTFLDNPAGSNLKSNMDELIKHCSSKYQASARAAFHALNLPSLSPAANLKAANKLLSILNSAPENLRPALKYLNEYVNQNFDPQLAATPGGQHIRATDHTKSVAMLGASEVGSLLVTPTHGRVVSSDGPAPFAAMTPATRKSLQKFTFETRNADSPNVQAALSNPNPYGLAGAPAPGAAPAGQIGGKLWVAGIVAAGLVAKLVHDYLNSTAG